MLQFKRMNVKCERGTELIFLRVLYNKKEKIKRSMKLDASK